MKKYFTTNLIGNFIKIIIVLVLVFIGFNYLGPLIAFFICYSLISFLRFKSEYFKHTGKGLFKKVLFYASPAFITSIASALIGYGHYIILTILKDPSVTGIFAVSFTLTGLLSVIPSIMSFSIFPIMSALSTRKNMKNKQGYLIALVSRYALFLLIPLSIVFIVFSKVIVLLFSRPDYLFSTNYFPILVPSAILVGLASLFHNTIFAVGKPNIQRNIIVLTAVIFLLTSILLTNYFSATGLSVAYLITVTSLFFMSFIYIKKHLEIRFYTNDILKILFSSFLIALILYFLRPFVNSLFTFLIVVIPTLLLYLVLLLLFKFYRTQDIRLLEIFGEKIPILGKYMMSLSKFLNKYYKPKINNNDNPTNK